MSSGPGEVFPGKIFPFFSTNLKPPTSQDPDANCSFQQSHPHFEFWSHSSSATNPCFLHRGDCDDSKFSHEAPRNLKVWWRRISFWISVCNGLVSRHASMLCAISAASFSIGFWSEFQKARCQNCKTFPHLTSLELHQQAVQEIARLRTQLEEECNCIASLTYLWKCRKVYLLQILARWCEHSYIVLCLLCYS